jgi:hypothetical protein
MTGTFPQVALPLRVLLRLGSRHRGDDGKARHAADDGDHESCCIGPGDWWASRGYDPAFGRKLPGLFERCGLVDVQADAHTELVRGGSVWARWYAESLNVIHQAAGSAGTGAQRHEHEQIVAALADSSAWLMRELLHCCRGRRPPRPHADPPAG